MQLSIRGVILAFAATSVFVAGGDATAAHRHNRHEGVLHLLPSGAVSMVTRYTDIQQGKLHSKHPGFIVTHFGPVSTRSQDTIRRLTHELNSFEHPRYWECEISPYYVLTFRFVHRPTVRIVTDCAFAGLRGSKKAVVQVNTHFERTLARLLLPLTHSRHVCRQRWHGRMHHFCMRITKKQWGNP